MRSFVLSLSRHARSRASAQIMVLFAVFLVILMVLAGSAYDYASIVVDDTRLQNAVDAAVLAGSDALSRPTPGADYNTIKAGAQSTAVEYLRLNGVSTQTPTTNVNIVFPTSTPVAGVPTPAAPYPENINISVTRAHQTAFWPLIGIPSVNMNDAGGAHAARGMIDVMLSLDTTSSMTNQFPDLRSAVDQFVTAMNPQVSDPRSPRIGLTRFQGETCTDNPTHTPAVYNCQSDYTVLSNLTGDASVLLKLADNIPTTGSCPNGVAALGSGSGYACPIGFHTPGSGTKLPNGIYAVDGSGAGAPSVTPPYAWTTANARNNNNPSPGSGWAKKILIMMTDGEDNDQYSGDRTSQNSQWDSDVVTAAQRLEQGPNTSDPNDDVEIYVINFQCDPTNGVTYTNGGCTSQLASSTPHLCPGPLPASYSHTDDVLIRASSSKSGTCDHYYPLAKDEDLPTLFLQLAGTISRGALTQ